MKARERYKDNGFDEAVYLLMDVAEANGFDVEVDDNFDDPRYKDVIMTTETQDDDIYSFSVVVNEETDMKDITNDLYCEWQNFDAENLPAEGERLVGDIYNQMLYIENFVVH